MTKKIVFICAFLGGIFFFFREPLEKVCVRYAVQRQCKDISFSSTSLSLEEGAWVFNNPQFTHAHSSLRADRLVVSVSPSFKNLSLHLSLSLDTPILELSSSEVDWKGLLIGEESFSKWPFFELTRSLEITRGTFLLDSKEGKENREVAFSLSYLQTLKKIEGVIHLHCLEKNNLFSMAFEQQREGGEFWSEVSCDQFDLSQLYQGWRALGGTFFGWEIDHGIADGKLFFSLKSDGRYQMFGRADLTNFQFNHASSNIRGDFPRAQVMLEKKGRDRSGLFRLPQGGSLYFEQQALSLTNLIGEVETSSSGDVHLALDGQCYTGELCFPIKLYGQGSKEKKRISSVQLTLEMAFIDREVASFTFDAAHLIERQKEIELFVENFPVDILTPALSPLADQLRFEGGVVSGRCVALVEGKYPTQVVIDQVSVSDLKAMYSPLGVDWVIDRGKGAFEVDLLATDVLSSINGKFEVESGMVQGIDFYGVPLNFEQLHTQLSIQKGVIQNSVLRGVFAGMDGEIFADFSRTATLEYRFFGEMRDVISSLPEFFEKMLMPFQEDRIALIGKMRPDKLGMRVLGDLLLNDRIETFQFGFVLERGDPKLWKRWPPEQEGVESWRSWGREAFAASVPPIIAPALAGAIHYIDGETHAGGIVVKNGWITAEKIPLEKYLSPIIFHQKEGGLTGVGAFSGHFDQKGMVLEYEGEQVELFSPYFRLAFTKKIKGEHYLNFFDGIAWGNFPFEEAVYEDKISALEFSSFSGKTLINGNTFSVLDISTQCDQVGLQGELLFDFSKEAEETFDVEIAIKAIDGDAAEIVGILRKIDLDLNLQQLAVKEGKIIPGSDGMYIHFAFSKESIETKRWGTLCLSQLTGTLFSDLVHFKDFHLVCTIDERKNIFDFSDFFTVCQVGAEKFFVRGEGGGGKPFALDITVTDQFKEWARFKGEFLKIQDRFHLVFDGRFTHFDNTPPSQFEMEFSLKEGMTQFVLNMPFSLEKIARFVSMGQVFPNDLSIAGQMWIDLRLRPESGWALDLLGNEMRCNALTTQSFRLLGTKRENDWTIDTFETDTCNGFFQGSGWEVTQGVLTKGEGFSTKIAGNYSPSERLFKGSLTQLKFELQEFGEDYLGQFFGEGNFSLFQNRESQEIHTICDIVGDVTEGEAFGFRAKSIKEVCVHYATDEGVIVSNLNTELSLYGYPDPLAHIQVEKFQYLPQSAEKNLNNFSFSVDARRLLPVLQQVHLSFPESFGEEALFLLAPCKKEGEFKGSFSMDQSGLSLQLVEGMYYFWDTPYRCGEIAYYETSESKQCAFETALGRLMFQSTIGEHAQGSATLSNGPEQVVCRFREDPILGLQVYALKGDFYGFSFALLKDPSSSPLEGGIVMYGDMSIDGLRCRTLFSETIKEQFDLWGVGNGYTFSGRFHLKKQGNHYSLPKFSGTLTGKKFELKGYIFDSLTAACVFDGQYLSFSDLVVVDPAIRLSIPRFAANRSLNDEWDFSCPTMTFTQFKPSILEQVEGSATQTKRAFVIERCEVKGCDGTFGQTFSWSGKGNFQFTNKRNQTANNTLIQIPAEIVTRIGLNPAILTPVAGKVYFSLDKDRIWFTDFSGVQSEGKYSKFYLSTHSPSSLGLEGDLNLNVEVRQHKLLLKLAHLFDVSVKGSVWNPEYSLKKRQRRSASSIH